MSSGSIIRYLINFTGDGRYKAMLGKGFSTVTASCKWVRGLDATFTELRLSVDSWSGFVQDPTIRRAI